VSLFGRDYENSLYYVYKLFSGYFRKLSSIAYENSLYLLYKQFDLGLSFVIEIAYT